MNASHDLRAIQRIEERHAAVLFIVLLTSGGVSFFGVLGKENDNGDWQGLQVLLELDVLISSQQRIELGGSFTEQSAIIETGPTHLHDGANVVADEAVGERPGQRFI